MKGYLKRLGTNTKLLNRITWDLEIVLWGNWWYLYTVQRVLIKMMFVNYNKDIHHRKSSFCFETAKTMGKYEDLKCTYLCTLSSRWFIVRDSDWDVCVWLQPSGFSSDLPFCIFFLPTNSIEMLMVWKLSPGSDCKLC